jgi:hypothetical protein
MKPSIDYLNIVTVKDVIRQIEKSGKEKINIAELPGLLHATEQTIMEVITHMQANHAAVVNNNNSPVATSIMQVV